MDKGFDVFRVSNFVIDTAKENNVELTNLKLQKILFFLQGFYLHKYKKRLINGEFAKWQYGPIEREVYDCFKSNGSSPIHDEAFDFSLDTLTIIPIPPISAAEVGRDIFPKLKSELLKLLEIPTWRLIELTHNDPSWSNYQDEIKNYSAADYTNQEIESCYINNFDSQYCEA
ncbi:Panacea domain-containing protein [Lactobacillus delbrueckii]|uniref:Panacea domain-containing protein n=1 Tax=Lactobacillus delbrueckii TaxID=1584 RepID=UPI0022E721A5|nr:type II toxin-antitoxin system antitoxin SocA domain-containing protein [Lactobacillus delbrueckii]